MTWASIELKATQPGISTRVAAARRLESLQSQRGGNLEVDRGGGNGEGSEADKNNHEVKKFSHDYCRF